MSDSSASHEVTEILRQWGEGDAHASDRLMPLVYDELRRLARSYLRQERGGHTLQPTALVHEAYLRMVGQREVDWKSRAHFFSIAARLMRRILVDHARARNAEKRGGGVELVSLDAMNEPSEEPAFELVALDGALEELAKEYPRQSQVVELRFFGGLEAREIAGMLRVSEKTILRDWNFAKLWLLRALSASPTPGHAG